MATPPCQITTPEWGRQCWRQCTGPHLVALHLGRDSSHVPLAEEISLFAGPVLVSTGPGTKSRRAYLALADTGCVVKQTRTCRRHQQPAARVHGAAGGWCFNRVLHYKRCQSKYRQRHVL